MAEEVIIAQVEKHEAPKNAESEIAVLQALEMSMGWQVLLRIMKENITYLEQAILEKIDPISKQLISDEEVEKMRYKRQISKELIDTPRNYIKILSVEKEPEKEFDPYYQDADDIRKDQSR